MAEPFPLIGEGLRNYLRTNGAGLFSQFPSGTLLLAELRSQGVKIATGTFFAIRREVLGLVKFQEQITGLDTDTLVPQSFMVSNHGLKLSGRFQYRFRISIEDPDTGDITDEWASIITDDQLTPQGAIDELQRISDELKSDYRELIAQYSLIQVLMRPK